MSTKSDYLLGAALSKYCLYMNLHVADLNL